jgi:hypothetical protein
VADVWRGSNSCAGGYFANSIAYAAVKPTRWLRASAVLTCASSWGGVAIDSPAAPTELGGVGNEFYRPIAPDSAFNSRSTGLAFQIARWVQSFQGSPD